MSEVRLIDANALKEEIETYYLLQSDQIDGVCKLIENAPKVEIPKGEYKCVTCKYCSCKITEMPCRECSRSYTDHYEIDNNSAKQKGDNMPTYEDLIKFVKLICKSERTEEEQEFFLE